MNPVEVCQACLIKRGIFPAGGRWPCPEDGRDITEHVRVACPIGRHRRGVGDWIAWTAHKVWAAHIVKLIAERRGKPCNCAKRQQTANARFRGLWLWCLAWGRL